MFVIAGVLVTYGLIFAKRHPYCFHCRSLPGDAVEPGGALSDTVCALSLPDGSRPRLARTGGLAARRWVAAPLRPAQVGRISAAGLRDLVSIRALYGRWQQISGATLVRCVVAFVLLAVLTLIPYGLFVKYFALRGVPNLSETVPGDFYFITDASISLGHLLAFDMAGIMDKVIGGDYLSKVPRYANVLYTLLILLPLIVPAIRRQVFDSRPRRAFLFIAYLNVFFSMWATLGYSDPQWFPTFHRTIALISRMADGMQSPIGDLILKLTSTIVQVLRFPHRFQLILFMMGCVLIPISLAWIGERTAGGAATPVGAPEPGDMACPPGALLRADGQQQRISRDVPFWQLQKFPGSISCDATARGQGASGELFHRARLSSCLLPRRQR